MLEYWEREFAIHSSATYSLCRGYIDIQGYKSLMGFMGHMGQEAQERENVHDS